MKKYFFDGSLVYYPDEKKACTHPQNDVHTSEDIHVTKMINKISFDP